MAYQIATYGETEYLDNNRYIRRGYVLSGWATSSTADRFSYVNRDTIKNVIESNSGKDVIDLYGIWADTSGSEEDGTNESVTVTYDPNGGKVGGRAERFNVEIRKGAPFTKENGEKEGYRLEGYKNEYGEWIAEGTPINISTVAIAEWQDNVYHLYYVGGNKAEAADGVVLNERGEYDGGEHRYSDRYNLAGAVFKREGYYLASWSGSERVGSETYELGEEVSKLTEGDIKKLYAIWKGNSYEIRYVGGENAEGTVRPTSFTYGDKVVLSSETFKKVGMEQIGWKYTNGEGTEYVYGIGENNQVDTSVFDVPTLGYVEMSAIYGTSNYKVRLKANGGLYSDGRSEKEERIKYNESTKKFERPQRRGYKFNNYVVTRNGVEEALKERWEYTDVTEVVASYSGIKYYVEYRANGGRGSMPYREEYTYGERKAVRANEYEREGYRFSHWELEDGREVGERE